MNGIQYKKGAELVTDHLLGQLKNGSYSPGDRLPSVEALSKQYQVGRSTIREALSALKAMGWLDIRHGGGTFVREQPQAPSDLLQSWLTDIDSLKSLIEVRKIVEVGSAGLAAKRRTDTDLAALADCLQQMEAHLEDETASEQDDLMFHVHLAQASHNDILIPMLQLFHQQCAQHMGNTRRMWLFGERSSTMQLLQEHRLIYDAILHQNEAIASRRMLEHLTKVELLLEKND
ncbi:FadR/GntR family transcriptional regulator [Paenibacillus apiarius]|uniref:FadR family transcriptional regulator n=1 Tax=Paenibacillus apiarius TaxID=46240 RepID=A0ABT4DLU4_9BACL|nr:FadR/GntR family transcriptional regulator [Paenibacillus apiarius]MCY9514899.1 FadR family transcriptional regulator [Paenibacillus apiarius]MCY9518322.1 FadR family transcriptional regulator [Paenibacillus apiarius]MCY9551277.1 FadR family transcriptional regulator [Paenibacillus apiarius]MCY9558431.1 FadR family transcriptional regulator [Paenibacillus apiarius]MCY9687140.1 FadR family transcriptional regulator [Paenibacillus apiarius]